MKRQKKRERKKKTNVNTYKKSTHKLIQKKMRNKVIYNTYCIETKFINKTKQQQQQIIYIYI